MGTWAELRADDGRLEVTRTGQTSELTGAMRAAPPVLDGPADYLARYGRFGAGADGEPVAVDFWSNVTMSPDFPSVTEVIAQLYPASGGRRDRRRDRHRRRDDRPLPRAHRPIAGRGAGRLDAADRRANAVQYLLRDQYAEIADDATATPCSRRSRRNSIDDVFGGDLPGPRVLAAHARPGDRRGPDGGVVAARGGPAAAPAAGDRRRAPGARRRRPRRRQHERRRQQARRLPAAQHRLRRRRRRGRPGGSRPP